LYQGRNPQTNDKTPRPAPIRSNSGSCCPDRCCGWGAPYPVIDSHSFSGVPASARQGRSAPPYRITRDKRDGAPRSQLCLSRFPAKKRRRVSGQVPGVSRRSMAIICSSAQMWPPRRTRAREPAEHAYSPVWALPLPDGHPPAPSRTSVGRMILIRFTQLAFPPPSSPRGSLSGRTGPSARRELVISAGKPRFPSRITRSRCSEWSSRRGSGSGLVRAEQSG